MHLSYLEPVSCFSSVWWLPDHRNCSPSWLPWRAGVDDDYVSWLSRKYSTSQPPQVALVIKNPPPNAGDYERQVWSLGQEDPLEEGMATHSRILTWRNPQTEEPGGLQSTVSQSQTRLKQFSMHPFLSTNEQSKIEIKKNTITTRVNTWYTLDVNMLKDLLNLYIWKYKTLLREIKYSLNKYNCSWGWRFCVVKISILPKAVYSYNKPQSKSEQAAQQAYEKILNITNH